MTASARIHSKAEQEFQELTGFEKIDCLLPYTFRDKNGHEYKAKADFMPNDPRLPDLVIEYKPGRLNSLTCKQSSINAIARLEGQASTYDHLKTGYNHALPCKVEIQDEMNPLWYLVCFKSNPTPKDAGRYAKAGLLWCTVKTLAACLDCLAAARDGKQTTWQVVTRKYTATFPALHVNIIIAHFRASASGRTLH